MNRFATNVSSPSRYRSELMGICILWIMLFHSSIPKPTSFSLKILWNLFVRSGAGCGVAIFLICSGFGLTYSCINKERAGLDLDCPKYYRKRLIRILPAYLMVSASYFIILFGSIKDVVYHLSFMSFLVEGRRYFWYILAAFFCYMVFPVFVCLKRKMNFRITLMGLSLIAALAAFALRFYAREVYDNIEIMLWRIPCFWMGCYYGVLDAHGKKREFYIATALFTGIGIALFAVSGFSRNMYTFISPFVMTVFCALLELARMCSLRYVGYALKWIGGISLEQYLVHVSYGVELSKLIFAHTGQRWISAVSYYAVSFALAIMLNFLLKSFMKWKKKSVSDSRIKKPL